MTHPHYLEVNKSYLIIIRLVIATLIARQALSLLLQKRDAVIINTLTDVARFLQTSPLSLSTLSTRSSISADYAASLAHQLIAKLPLNPMRAWSSFSLAQLVHSNANAFLHLVAQQKSTFVTGGSREWSGKRMAGWTQSENLLLGLQHQLLSIDPLSEVDLFQ